jgi:HD-GYP domain-containing protein (c-di-GMP phosphodiesterase class II)
MKNGDQYIAVSPLMIFPQTRGEFKVFLKSGGREVLYTQEMELFTEQHRRRLVEHGVDEVYILASQRKAFERYMENHIGAVLDNPEIPVEERAQVFMDTTRSVAQDVFEERLPQTLRLKKHQFERIQSLVSQSLLFVSTEQALKRLSALMSHDYKLYTHSINTFVYLICLLSSYQMDDTTMLAAGMGAILHDVGKTALPRDLLDTPPSRLKGSDLEFYRSHPVRGAAMCAMVPLDHDTLNCILLHHERMDGTGFPSRIAGESLPLVVRALSVVNAYDNLTSNRTLEHRLTPFQALHTIREDMKGAFDKDIYKRLVKTLAGAEIA